MLDARAALITTRRSSLGRLRHHLGPVEADPPFERARGRGLRIRTTRAATGCGSNARDPLLSHDDHCGLGL